MTKKVAHSQLVDDAWLADDILALDHGELLTACCDRTIVHAQHQGKAATAWQSCGNEAGQQQLRPSYRTVWQHRHNQSQSTLPAAPNRA